MEIQQMKWMQQCTRIYRNSNSETIEKHFLFTSV